MRAIGQIKIKLLAVMLLAGMFTVSLAAQAQTTLFNYTLASSVGSLAFSAQAGGAATAPQALTIWDTSPCPPLLGVLTCHWPTVLTVDQPWLSVTPASGTTALNASVTVNTSGMAPGVYSGNITATALQLVGSVVRIPVTLTITAPPAVAPTVAAQPMSQTINSGQAATFLVAATGTAPLSYQWSKNGTAIGGATGSSYTTPAETVSDNGAQFTVTVSNVAGSATTSAATLTVSQQTYNYSLQPSVGSLSFSAQLGGAAPAAKSVTIWDTSPCPPPAGVPTCHWATTLSVDQPWLSVTPSSGTTALNASVTVKTSGLAAGSYAGNVIATAQQLVGSPIKIPVTLTVTGAGSSVLTSSVSTLNFNTVNVGSNSSLGVTLTNGGSASITISGVSVSGAGFTPSGVSSGLILSGGQSATLNVMFAPGATGAVSGSVTVTSTASNATLSIPVSGSGAQPASRTVTLNWAASGSTVAGYNVLRSTVSGGSYTQVNGTPASTPQYIDTGVQSGQTYYYVVTAVDNSGTQSPYSNEVAVIVP